MNIYDLLQEPNQISDPKSISGKIQEWLGAKEPQNTSIQGLLTERLKPSGGDIGQAAVMTLMSGKPVSGQQFADERQSMDDQRLRSSMDKMTWLQGQQAAEQEMLQKQQRSNFNNQIMGKLFGNPTSPQAGPLSVRNNNPGNLRSPQGGFQQFSSPQEGMDATKRDLLNKISGKSPIMNERYGQGYSPTITNIISTWAPPSENDTNSYINFVAQKMGISPDEPLTPEQVDILTQAITQMEGGQEATQYYDQYAQNTTQANDSLQGMDEINQMRVMSALNEGNTDEALKILAESNKPVEATSPQGKIEQDYKNGLIPKDVYDAVTQEDKTKYGEVDKAKKSFDIVLGKIEKNLDNLDKEGAIVNRQKNPPGPDVLYNLAVNSGNTGAGQYGARLLGTKAQGYRDEIQSLKRTLTPLLMKATGMSSQQLNSNVELMTFLDSLGNPMSNIQTNKEIINTLRQLYGKSGPKENKANNSGWTIEAVE
jgi:hypothetical protein